MMAKCAHGKTRSITAGSGEEIVGKLRTLHRSATEVCPGPQKGDGGWNDDGAIAQCAQAMRHNSWVKRINAARQQLTAAIPETADFIEAQQSTITALVEALECIQRDIRSGEMTDPGCLAAHADAIDTLLRPIRARPA